MVTVTTLGEGILMVSHDRRIYFFPNTIDIVGDRKAGKNDRLQGVTQAEP